MIRVAMVIGKMNSGGKKNLVMEYYRQIDREKVQFDFICDADSEAIPDEEIERLGGRVYRIPPYQRIFSNMRAMYLLYLNICRLKGIECVLLVFMGYTTTILGI